MTNTFNYIQKNNNETLSNYFRNNEVYIVQNSQYQPLQVKHHEPKSAPNIPYETDCVIFVFKPLVDQWEQVQTNYGLKNTSLRHVELRDLYFNAKTFHYSLLLLDNDTHYMMESFDLVQIHLAYFKDDNIFYLDIPEDLAAEALTYKTHPAKFFTAIPYHLTNHLFDELEICLLKNHLMPYDFEDIIIECITRKIKMYLKNQTMDLDLDELTYKRLQKKFAPNLPQSKKLQKIIEAISNLYAVTFANMYYGDISKLTHSVQGITFTANEKRIKIIILLTMDYDQLRVIYDYSRGNPADEIYAMSLRSCDLYLITTKSNSPFNPLNLEIPPLS